MQFLNEPETPKIELDCKKPYLKQAVLNEKALIYSKPEYQVFINQKSESVLQMAKKLKKEIPQPESKPVEKPFQDLVALLMGLDKPIVIHNGIFDILYTYDQFIDSLPEKLETFNEQVRG